jgi:hypothetical protein
VSLWTILGPHEIVWLLVAAVFAALLAVQWHGGESRDYLLEQRIPYISLRSPEGFVGTLTVEQHSPGQYLRLSNRSERCQELQFQYRWLIDLGSKIDFEEVTFDAVSGVVELTTKHDQMDYEFSALSTIRMKEAYSWGDTLWQIELVPAQGKPILIAASDRSPSRQGLFERTAPLAKVLSDITQLPIQVFVARNVWTYGWSPKENRLPNGSSRG